MAHGDAYLILSARALFLRRSTSYDVVLNGHVSRHSVKPRMDSAKRTSPTQPQEASLWDQSIRDDARAGVAGVQLV